MAKLSMKKLLSAHDHNWEFNFLIAVMTDYCTKTGLDFDKVFLLKTPLGPEPIEDLNVVISINGIEVDWESYITRLQKFFEEAVSSSARQLVKDKLSDVYGKLSDLENKVGQVVESVLPSEESFRR
jgi:hypothetical protein